LDKDFTEEMLGIIPFIRRYYNNKYDKVKKIESNITSQQIQVIKELYYNNYKLSQRQIEKKINIRRSSVSSLIKTMIKNNLVEKDINENDARGKMITLTEHGIEIYEEILKESLNIDEEVFRGIEKKEIDIFYKVLGKAKENIIESIGEDIKINIDIKSK